MTTRTRKPKTLTFTVPVQRVVIDHYRLEVPLTAEIKQALHDWLSNACYVGHGGKYWIKATPKRRAHLAPWNDAVWEVVKPHRPSIALHAMATAAQVQGLL